MIHEIDQFVDGFFFIIDELLIQVFFWRLFEWFDAFSDG